MSQIFVNNLIIMWGDLKIHKMFDIISTGDFPTGVPFSYKTETMPNGKTRLIQSVDSNNTFTITVSRENAKDSIKIIYDTFLNQATTNTTTPLRITNKLDGEVLADYDVAALISPKKAGSVEDNKGNDITLEWSVANEQ